MDHNKLWKILQEMGIPDHLTCLLRNRYEDQAATVRTGHGTTDWFQIGKVVHQGCWRRQWQPTPVFLPEKSPWTEEPGRLQSMGSLEVGTTERLHFHFSLSYIGEGIDNPLQCSCLENPRDGGAWWAAICGVAQSRTRLKRLSSSSSSSSIEAQHSHHH